MPHPIVCTPKSLPDHQLVAAGEHAVRENPANHAPIESFIDAPPKPTAWDIAMLRKKYWAPAGVSLTVKFLDRPSRALRTRILAHMNAWNATANVEFNETDGDGQVRIARTAGDGYWSYIGVDIKLVPSTEPTMNLDSFSSDTPEAEFRRVVRHETGHTLGFVHEHMRRDLVERIHVAKAIVHYGATQGWSEHVVRAQVLTPIEEWSLQGTTPDPDSIMCYQIPAGITKNNEAIVGGLDIDALDYTFAGKLYPKALNRSMPVPRAG